MGLMEEKITRKSRPKKGNSEKLHDLYLSPNINRVQKQAKREEWSTLHARGTSPQLLG